MNGFEAYKKAKEIKEENTDKFLNEIMAAVVNAVDRGLFEVRLSTDKEIEDTYIVKSLKANGYSARFVDSVMEVRWYK